MCPTNHHRHASCSLLTSTSATGPRRGSSRVRHQHLAADHLREHGLWRRPAHGEDDGRLKRSSPGRLDSLALRWATRRWCFYSRGRYVCVVSTCFPLRCTRLPWSTLATYTTLESSTLSASNMGCGVEGSVRRHGEGMWGCVVVSRTFVNQRC